MENLVTIETTEISQSVSVSVIEAAKDSLTKESKLSEVNLVIKNWDTSEVQVFEKAVFLGIEVKDTLMPDGTLKELPCVLFMDLDNNIWYKASFKFVKVFQSGMIKVGGLFRAEFVGIEKMQNGNKAENFKVQQYI